MHRIALFIAVFLFPLFSTGQEKDQRVFTSDIDNFWIAYDSVQTTKDSVAQLNFIQQLYVDKGTAGLKEFMKVRDYSPGLWIWLIRSYPKFWNSVRPNTLLLKPKAKEIETSIARLKLLYPGLSEAKMYFTIGGLTSGGTTTGNSILIGAEIATGNASTDVSEFPDRWLQGVFKEQSIDNFISLNIHEYVHTQQVGERADLLSRAIGEGSCDFISELVIEKPLQKDYIIYGKKHEKELKEKFKQEMFTTAYANWLYNSSRAETVADLGYFMGYSICANYYEKAKNKKKAIEQIIRLNYSDEKGVEKFLKNSMYYQEPVDKAKLIEQFEAKRPVVEAMEPFRNGDTLVDPALTELKIVFSKPMKKGYSFNAGAGGKEYYPLAAITGLSDDGKTLPVKLTLKAGHEYEFIITDRGFIQPTGIRLKSIP